MKLINWLWYIAIAGLLVTGSMTTKNRHLLLSDISPAGIVSLELTSNDSVQREIFNQWDRPMNYVYERDWTQQEVAGKNICAIQVAQRQVHADFYFILFYSACLILLFFQFSRLNTSSGTFSLAEFLLLSGGVMLAGLLDVIENINILKSIDLFNAGKMGVAQWVFYPALFKFMLLIAALIFFIWRISFFKRLTGWLSSFSATILFGIKLGWNFRIVLILLFVLFALLNFSDQGQDLIVTVNTSFWGTILFMLLISVFAALNWYLPKLYSTQYVGLLLVVPKGTSLKEKAEVDYARLLGVLTFLIPAIGILKTMQQYHIPYLLDDMPAFLVLLVLFLIFKKISSSDGLDLIFKKNGVFQMKRYVLAMSLLFLLMVAMYFIKSKSEVNGHLSYLAIDLYLLALGFLISVTYRKEMIALANIPVAPYVIGSGLFFGLIFILFNFPCILFALTEHNRYFTLAIVIAALIAYAMIFSFLLMLGRKMKVQWITFLLVFGLFISYGTMSGFHKVHSVKIAGEVPAPDSLEVYIAQWLESRRPEIAAYQSNNKTTYPVFFVNSYGGGIRASAWATTVVGELDRLLLEKSGSQKISKDFQHHVFSYSGASGGTVGFSMLTADRLRIRDSLVTKQMYPEQTGIYAHDYLTANIVGIFGRDALMSILGSNFYDDRQRLQERTFEKRLSESYQMNYDVLLRNTWTARQFEIPLLFSNTYDINTGKKGIMAPVTLKDDDFPSCIFIQDLMKEQGVDLPLSAAAFLSARFPFVCPTGKFDEKHHFTDGGTLENSGAETSQQVIAVFERVLAEPRFADLKISINILSISNSLLKAEHPEQDKNLYEVLAPALGLLQTISSNAIKADKVSEVLAKRGVNWHYFKVQPTEKSVNGTWPVLPLGWQISDDALAAMRASIKSQRTKMDSILKVSTDRLMP